MQKMTATFRNCRARYLDTPRALNVSHLAADDGDPPQTTVLALHACSAGRE